MNGKMHSKRQSSTATVKSTSSHLPAPPSLQLLVTVVNREKAELYLALLSGFEINMQMSMSANGTASEEMRRYLGLPDSEKAVIFSVIREEQAQAALRFLEEKFNTLKNGKGIAFTIPMTGVIGVAIYRFLSNNR